MPLAFPPAADLNRLAYYFEATFPSEGREMPGAIDSLTDELIRWYRCWKEGRNPGLWVDRTGEDAWVVEDTRDTSPGNLRGLNSDGYALLRRCRLPQNAASLENTPLLADLVTAGCIIEVDRKLLSVVCERATSGRW